MADETLDLTPLQRAIERLDEGWKRYQQDISDTQIRDGLIQRVNGFGILSGLEIKQPTPGFNAPFPKGQIIAAGLDQDR